jgi:hypothetical protein
MKKNQVALTETPARQDAPADNTENTANSEKKVRPIVKELLQRNLDKHSDTWAELAKH